MDTKSHTGALTSEVSGSSLDVYDSLTRTLLRARGITDAVDADVFFTRAYDSGLHDPFLLPDMERAVARILDAVVHGERIGIFSDYDCDGIPAGVLLHDFFVMIGYENFRNYIPHRHEEGYGVSVEAVNTLHADGVTLIITLDCGSADRAAVAHAQRVGVDVIITDHHELGELPDAYAIINPKRSDSVYPFRDLCGTGIAFKLVSALLQRGTERALFSVAPGQEKWLLDLVGIATIADMVPLQGENRILAHYGLMVLRKGRRLGLQHLFRVMRTQLSSVTEDDIGFMIAPRINAASRMGSPEDAFALLSTRSEEDAGMHARHLDTINAERKGVVAAMVKEARKKMSLRTETESVIVIGDPSWRPSLVGLVANALAEEYACPVFVWGRDGRMVLKGSCRSGGGINVFALMQQVAHVFLEFGGHHASGGFAVKEDQIHTLGETLNAAYATLPLGERAASVPQPVEADAVLTLSDVAPALARTLSRFAPFGVGNPKPLFSFIGVTPVRVELFGKQKAHTKIIFRDGLRELSAIGFFMTPDAYEVLPRVGVALDMQAHVEESTFMGRREIRLRIVTLRSGQNGAR